MRRRHPMPPYNNILRFYTKSSSMSAPWPLTKLCCGVDGLCQLGYRPSVAAKSLNTPSLHWQEHRCTISTAALWHPIGARLSSSAAALCGNTSREDPKRSLVACLRQGRLCGRLGCTLLHRCQIRGILGHIRAVPWKNEACQLPRAAGWISRIATTQEHRARPDTGRATASRVACL
jgi:hypothetical protein